MYPLNRITQHVLNHQKIRLDAFIDRCMWDLQSWVNLPMIPQDLQSSRRDNISTVSSTKKRIQDTPQNRRKEENKGRNNTGKKRTTTENIKYMESVFDDNSRRLMLMVHQQDVILN